MDYNEISAKVKESLVEDDEFSNVLAKSVSSSATNLLNDKLADFKEEFETKLSKQNEDLLNELDVKINSSNIELKRMIENNNNYQAQIDKINNQLSNMNKDLEAYAADVNDPSNYSVNITPYIPQIVDAVLPEITDSVLVAVDDNKTILFDDIYSAISELKNRSVESTSESDLTVEPTNNDLSDEQIIAIYEKYRANLVMDITNEILDDIEKKVTANVIENLKTKEEVIAPVADMPKSVATSVVSDSEMENETSKESIEPVADVSKSVPTSVVSDNEMETTPTEEETNVPSKPTFSQTAKIDDNPSPVYVNSNTISIIATSDGSNIQKGDKDLSKTVEVPSFSSTPSVKVMDPVEYEKKRAEVREAAINNILDMIK